MGLSSIIGLISTLLNGGKIYLYIGLALGACAGEGYLLYRVYETGVTNASAQYEVKLAKIAEVQAAEVKRQSDANSAAQQDLQTQLTQIKNDNAVLQNQISTNKKAAAASPTANTIAVPAASVQRLRAIRGH